MAIPAAAIAKAAIGVLSNEKTRKAAGWVLVAILSPIILLAAFCSILGGSADHNSSILDLCFYGGTLPADIPAEYRAYIEDMQASFALLDERIAEINSMTEDGESLDAIRVKAFFYALYFGAESPSSRAHQQFVDCFVTYEERTRPLDSTDSEDESAGEPEEETYTVAIPITDIATIWSNIQTALGETVTEEQRNNADSIYNLVRYGSATGTEGWIPGAEVPFIGADGFCSPVGSSWESRVTSEFGYRSDPFTGQTKGHTGIDIAVPTGTPVRAALPGVVTKATYNAGGYGYYVMIDHGNGMVTLYAHNSKLLVSVGDTVEAGDTVSLSGSTGRSTGPHLHFEVRVNGQRVNPRSYLIHAPTCPQIKGGDLMKEKEITVLKVEPGKSPETVTMPNTLDAMQKMVGGYIEVLPLSDVCLVCNEDGKLLGLEGQRHHCRHILSGWRYSIR